MAIQKTYTLARVKKIMKDRRWNKIQPTQSKIFDELKSAGDYFTYYSALYDKYSDKKLIETFNSSVGVRAWNVARQGILGAVRAQLEKRKIDFSEVGDEKVMSYTHKVKLVNKKLIKLEPEIKGSFQIISFENSPLGMMELFKL